MINLTNPDLMALMGYFLGSFAAGWILGAIVTAFKKLAEKIQ